MDVSHLLAEARAQQPELYNLLVLLERNGTLEAVLSDIPTDELLQFADVYSEQLQKHARGLQASAAPRRRKPTPAPAESEAAADTAAIAAGVDEVARRSWQKGT